MKMIKKGCIILITLLNTLGLSAQSTKVYTPIPPDQVHATASSEITKAAKAVNDEGMEGDMHIAQNLGHKMWTSKASTGKIRANEFTKEGVVWFMCEIGKTFAPVQVDLIKIWNQNQSQHTRRGLKKVYIEYSADGKTWKLLKNKELDYHIIRESKGQNPEPASFIFETGGIKAKYICITADANGEGNYYDPKDKYILREAADIVPLPEKRITINGTMEKTYEVEPLLRIEWVDEPVVNADRTVTVRAKVTYGTDKAEYKVALAEGWLFVSETDYVGDFSYSPNYSVRTTPAQMGVGAAEILGANGTTFTISTAQASKAFADYSRKYFFRVGVRSTITFDATNRYNYTDIKELTIPAK
jgi:hypothetical protein